MKRYVVRVKYKENTEWFEQGGIMSDFKQAELAAEQQFNNWNTEEVEIVELESTKTWKVEKVPQVTLTEVT